MKFQIKKQSSFSIETGKERYYYYLWVMTDEIPYGRVITVCYTMEEAKDLLNKIIDIFPEFDRKKELLHELDYNKIYLVSENQLNINTLEVERSFQIFNGINCVKVFINNHNQAIDYANELISKLSEDKKRPEAEIIYEITKTK